MRGGIGNGVAAAPAFARASYRFCREIISAARHERLGLQYMAVALGLKPLLDDWIKKADLADYTAACRRYGLHVLPDIQFVNVRLDDVPREVIGRERLTSTVAYGAPVSSEMSGEVHVYVARDPRLLRHGMWYPVIIRGRVIHPSFADSLRYGEILGYPDCCVEFYRRRNDWSLRSTLYEAFRATEGPPHIFCNPLLKDTWLSYIYHMPCSFRCPATLSWVRRLRARLESLEPALVKATDRALSRAFLVLYERDAVAFEGGRFKGARLSYESAFRLEPKPVFDPVLDALDAGDAVELRGRKVRVFDAGRVRRQVEVPLTSWAPRYMFLAEFRDV